MDVLVIGSGVAGLSCGIRLVEAGYAARIWARDLAPHTTSSVAAAVWYPYRAYPENLVLGWAASSYAYFGQLAQVPGSGVAMREGIELFPAPVSDPWWRAAVPSFRRAAAAELPPGYQDGYVFEAPVVEMPLYLARLAERFQNIGGQIERRPLSTIEQALAESAVVFNCAGLGARELALDQQMLAIRGQIVRVSQVGLERFVLDDHGPRGVTYIVPRSSDCILGGTADEGQEGLEPDQATAEAILERCAALEPRLRGASVLEHRVGLRPGRPAVRLERERRGDRLIVHNYGHGGAGGTLSWGCADAAVALLNDNQQTTDH